MDEKKMESGEDSNWGKKKRKRKVGRHLEASKHDEKKRKTHYASKEN